MLTSLPSNIRHVLKTCHFCLVIFAIRARGFILRVGSCPYPQIKDETKNLSRTNPLAYFSSVSHDLGKLCNVATLTSPLVTASTKSVLKRSSSASWSIGSSSGMSTNPAGTFSPSSSSSWCQFHRHFMSSFCAQILSTKNYKPT
jgi:hypothetical protein